MEKALVTGGTGFIGQHLAKQLRVARYVVRKHTNHLFTDVHEVERIDGQTDWSNAFDGVDVVFHLAGCAHNPREFSENYQNVNVKGTLHLAQQAVEAGVRRFIFVSSIGVNGTHTNDIPFTDSSPVEPHNPYAQSKYDAELGLKKIAKETGLEIVVVRPTLVYGFNAPGNFGLLTKLVRQSPILPFGLANNRRDFIAVQNLVDLLVTCASHPKASGRTFLASDTETVSTKDFTNAIAKGLNKTVIQLPIPVSLISFVGKLTRKSGLVEQLFGNLEVDSSSIRKVLGWTPPLTMEQAMETLQETETK